MEPVYTTRGFCPDNPHGFLSGLHLGSEVFSTKFLRTGWSGLQKLSLKVGLTSGILKFSAGTQVCPDDGCQVSSHFWPFCPDFHPALFKFLSGSLHRLSRYCRGSYDASVIEISTMSGPDSNATSELSSKCSWFPCSIFTTPCPFLYHNRLITFSGVRHRDLNRIWKSVKTWCNYIDSLGVRQTRRPELNGSIPWTIKFDMISDVTHSQPHDPFLDAMHCLIIPELGAV